MNGVGVCILFRSKNVVMNYSWKMNHNSTFSA